MVFTVFKGYNLNGYVSFSIISLITPFHPQNLKHLLSDPLRKSLPPQFRIEDSDSKIGLIIKLSSKHSIVRTRKTRKSFEGEFELGWYQKQTLKKKNSSEGNSTVFQKWEGCKWAKRRNTRSHVLQLMLLSDTNRTYQYHDTKWLVKQVLQQQITFKKYK